MSFHLLTELPMKPIGFIKTVMRSKFNAPHQPYDPSAQPGTIELLPDCNFEAALCDLIGFERIWLVWLAHKNKTWRPKVLPPRGPAKRRGVFATRSPHRPNPIGLTAVELRGINGRILSVGECDLVDGTPILDIKPYIPEIDSFAGSKTGWIEELENTLLTPPQYTISYTELAVQQIDWLRTSWSVEFLERAITILSRDPYPHRTRRISKIDQNVFKIGCGPWRMIYSISGETVEIQMLAPGYPRDSLQREGFDRIADRDAQVAFYEKFGK